MTTKYNFQRLKSETWDHFSGIEGIFEAIFKILPLRQKNETD